MGEPKTVGLLGEDRVHALLASALLDETLTSVHPALPIDGLRRWSDWGGDATPDPVPFMPSARAATRANGIGRVTVQGRPLRVHGRFGDAGGKTRRKLLWALDDERRPDLLVFLDDQDTRTVDPWKVHLAEAPHRALQLPDALRGVAIVVGVAVPEGEAWLVAGWTPQDAHERDRHAASRKHIGFDPCTAPERLTSDGEDRDAKRHARFLVIGEGASVEHAGAVAPEVDDRVRDRCLRDLATLRARGARCGAAAFLAALESAAVTVWAPAA